MSKVIGIVAIVILISLFGFIFFPNRQTPSKTFLPKGNAQLTGTETSLAQTKDIQASFAIFTNGTFRVFTAAMYHNLSQDVYIEASNPNVVKVKKIGITWNDFFSTLPFSLTSACLTTGTKETFCTGTKGKLQFYLNGTKNTDVLNQEIKQGDKLLVTFGKESEAAIQKQINKVP